MKERLPKGIAEHPTNLKVVVKYTLLQMPGLALFALLLFSVGKWLGLPHWLAWCLLGLWVAKDVVLFPFVWRSYDPDRPSLTYPMVGEEGVVIETLAPSGFVRVRGEIWNAEIVPEEAFAGKGDSVRVIGIQGLTLRVRWDGSPTGRSSPIPCDRSAIRARGGGTPVRIPRSHDCTSGVRRV
jgi:membrane protein implicated in regulation of membrane protease activity